MEAKKQRPRSPFVPTCLTLRAIQRSITNWFEAASRDEAILAESVDRKRLERRTFQQTGIWWSAAKQLLAVAKHSVTLLVVSASCGVTEDKTDSYGGLVC